MFESITKARQLGALVLERVGDYLELLKISAAIQGQNLRKRIISYVMMALFSGLSLIFAGLAVIVTCWDTPYRIASAWGVVGFYALATFLFYLTAPSQADSVSAIDSVQEELQQDIKLMKDII